MLAFVAPLPVERHDGGEYATYALSTGRVLYAAGTGGREVVRARTLADGATTTLAAPASGTISALAASDERVGFIVDAGEFSGPPQGPFAPVDPVAGAGTLAPDVLYVDGEHQLDVYRRSNRTYRLRWVMHEPGQPDRVLAIPAAAFVSVLAGDHIVYRVEGHPSVVADWRTGATERTMPDRAGEATVRADGTVAVRRGAGVYTAAPGAPLRRLATAPPATESSAIAWAGDRLVTTIRDGVAAIEPDGRVHRIGARSDDVEFDLATSPDAALYAANGCLVAVDLAAGPADAIGAGPCHRTDLAVRNTLRTSFLRCLAGPGGVCRIEVRRRGKARRFRLPIGRARRVRGTNGPHGARIFTVDPDGRRRSVPY